MAATDDEMFAAARTGIRELSLSVLELVQGPLLRRVTRAHAQRLALIGLALLVVALCLELLAPMLLVAAPFFVLLVTMLLVTGPSGKTLAVNGTLAIGRDQESAGLFDDSVAPA